LPSLPGLELRCDETFFSIISSILSFLHGHTGLLEWIVIHIPIDGEEDDDDRDDDEYDNYEYSYYLLVVS
jgi:hypothetical protein